MARYRKASGQMVEPAERYFRADGQMRKVIARYRKVAGVMQEVWPLTPGAAAITSVAMPFQNNRIELIVNWTAPTTGAAVTGYTLRLDFYNTNGTLARSTSLPFAAGVLTTTQTNGGAGFQADAGRTLRVTLTPSSASGPGASVTYPPVVVPQLPAPTAPTYSMSVEDAVATHTWSHAGGPRITGVELQMSIGTSPIATYRYPAASTGASVQPWVPATVGGGAVMSRLRTTGPGGASAWVTVTGDLPTPISFGNFRFHKSYLYSYLAGLSHRALIWYYRNGWTQTTTALGDGPYNVPGSNLWARDGSTYCHMGGQGYNPANGWTNRWQQTQGALKLPIPYEVRPVNSDSWRNGWEENYSYGDTDLVAQGTSATGTRTGYWFYNKGFQDKLNAARIGYDLNVTTSQIAVQRQDSGGLGAAVKPRLWMHAATTKPTNDYRPPITGGVDGPAIARGAGTWVNLAPSWVETFISGAQRGVALYHPNTRIESYLNTSLEYFLGNGHLSTWDGVPVGTVRIWHDS